MLYYHDVITNCSVTNHNATRAICYNITIPISPFQKTRARWPVEPRNRQIRPRASAAGPCGPHFWRFGLPFLILLVLFGNRNLTASYILSKKSIFQKIYFFCVSKNFFFLSIVRYKGIFFLSSHDGFSGKEK